MTWHPISLPDLESTVSRELRDCSAEQRAFFARTSVAPAKWHLHPWGDEGGGFWAVAVHQHRVLWYNDIEDGFNVSRFILPGEIPRDEYGCNQDPLRLALPRLEGPRAPPGSRPAPCGDAG